MTNAPIQNSCAAVHLLCATPAGDWLPAEGLLSKALALGEQGCDLSVDVAGLDSLGVDSLQLLLALKLSQARRGWSVTLLHLSPALRGVLHCVGAAELLGVGGQDA